MRATHTYALLEVSEEAYEEIKRKLLDAGYDQVITLFGEIDMMGIALIKAKEDHLPPTKTRKTVDWVPPTGTKAR